MPTSLRLLIVEDTPADAELMLLQLAAEGIQPDWTRVQTEADYLAALASWPELILADWSLPQFSGLRALQLMNARGLDIPFVIVSGSVGEEAAIDALHQGAYDYVLKDRPARLGPAVRRALEEKQLRTGRKRAEEALIKAAADWEATFNATADGIYLLDRDHRIIRINRALERMLNIRQEDAVGKFCWQAIHGTNEPIVDCPLARAKTSGRRESQEYRAGERVFDFVVDPIFDDRGALTGAVHIIRDITERKQAEQELRRTNAFLDSVIENIPDMIFLKDATDLRFVRFNRAGEELVGYARETLVGKNDYDLFPQAQADFFTTKDRDVLRRRDVVDVSEEFLQTRDRGQRILHTRKVPLLDAHGEPEYLLGISEDITERKQAEAERERLSAQVQAQALQLAQVMRTVPEGVLLLDAAGRIVLANPRAEGDLVTLAGARVGVALSHLGDRTLAELLSAPPKGLWHEAHAGERTYEIIAKSLSTGPSTEGWVLVLRDVTQERELQRRALQQERLAAVGHLAAGVAHDFNNILAVIALQARLALTAVPLPISARDRLAIIGVQAQRAADLVKQILDFSRQAVLERRAVDLGPFLAEQVKLLARTLPENITLELVGADQTITVNADLTRLQQVVMNLAVNARAAMPEGGRLRFALEHISALPADVAQRLETETLPQSWVQLTVTDTGVGIPPKVLPRIFEPFFTTKGPGQGSGLGLSQVHGIVKQHGGEISVHSRVGAGTTFVIYLPALAADVAPEAAPAASAPEGGGGQLILIVEDDAALRDALVDTVELLGYRTLSAANGRAALTILAQHGEIALILSDLIMPEMGGRALLHELKQRGVAAPVVILSGHPLDDELTSLRTLGLAGWLLKPLEMEHLAQVLAQVLAGS